MIRTSNGSFALKAAIALAAFLGWSPAFAKPAVTVRPIANPPGKIVYPRIVAGASVAVRQKVDKALAEAENADRGQRSDCLAATRQAGEAPDSHSFEETIKASYVSARYLSIDVRQSYFCATAYPTDDAGNPLSFDLVTGAALDWNQLFKPGFVPHDGETEPSTLTRLYQARYAASGLLPVVSAL